MSNSSQRLFLHPYPFEIPPQESPSMLSGSDSIHRALEDSSEMMIELTPVTTVIARQEAREQRTSSSQHQDTLASLVHAGGSLGREASFSGREASNRSDPTRSRLFTSDAANGNRESSLAAGPGALHYNSLRTRGDGDSYPSGQSTITTTDQTSRTAVSPAGLSAKWLKFCITSCDGGEFSPEYGAINILKDDQSVYCSRSRQNVNLLLIRQTDFSPMLPAPFKLQEVHVRIPIRGFTSPLRNGFIFVCARKVDMSDFDQYDTTPTMGLLDARSGQGARLPKVPPCVLTVLYFQLDRNTNEFHYSFKSPIGNCRYIFMKLLSSFGAKDSIDIEFVGFQGFEEKINFPKAALR